MDNEVELAWEEVSFWQDIVTSWIAEYHEPVEPHVLETLENAWKRYESALQSRKLSSD